MSNIIQTISRIERELSEVKALLGIGKPKTNQDAPRKTYKRRVLGGQNVPATDLARLRETTKTLVDQTNIRSVAKRARVSYGTVHRLLNIEGVSLRRESADRLMRLVAYQPVN